MSLNLNHLRILHAVLEQGSITGAAHALHISQPAVSRQLAELEAAVGAPLVDRLPRGVRPTAAGELLGERARRLFAEEEAAERELAELLGRQRGRLAVGASTTIGSYLVPGIFGEFSVRHPAIALELVTANTRAIQSDIVEGRVDVGLTEGFADADVLDVHVFAHDEMVLIAPPEGSDIAAAMKATVRARDLPGLPFIVREPGSGTRDVIEAALRSRGVTLRPRMSLGSTEAIKNAVAGGLGVAMVSRLAVKLELESGRLREVEVADLRIRRALHRLTPKGKMPSPAATAFLELLDERYGGE